MKDLEKYIVDDIMLFLAQNKPDWTFWKTWGNRREISRPDIQGFTEKAISVGIEIKRKKNWKLSGKQKNFLIVLHERGGFACCCNNKDYIFKLIKCSCGKTTLGNICFYCGEEKC